MCKKLLSTVFVLLLFAIFSAMDAGAFWVWTPKSKKMINPKYAVKDTPREQYEWGMYFFKQNEFNRAADELVRLVRYYPDSILAPEALYYAGRAYEEVGKYYHAFLKYQETVENYPYTERMDELIRREYNIANIFQENKGPMILDIPLTLSLERATTIYAKVVENSPFGEYADKALYNLGACYRASHKYNEAIDTYEKLIKDYPDSKLNDEAKYQLAYTKYEASLGPEYSQEGTEKALAELKRITHTVDSPEIDKEAEEKIRQLKERRAESDLEVAKFYENQGKYRSALIYYREIIGKFPETKAGQYAKGRIETIKRKIKD